MAYKAEDRSTGVGKATPPPGSSPHDGSGGHGRKKRTGVITVKGYPPGARDAPSKFPEPLPGDTSYDPKAKQVYFEGQTYGMTSDGRLRNIAGIEISLGDAPGLQGLIQIHDLSLSEGYLATRSGVYSVIERDFIERRPGSDEWIGSLGPTPTDVNKEGGDRFVLGPDVWHGAVLVEDPTDGKGIVRSTSDEVQAFFKAQDEQTKKLFAHMDARRRTG